MQREVYSISRLNREARALLEGSFPLLWVEGEVSNFSRPTSAHWYFTLKDRQAQVRCAMFRNRNALLTFVPEDGMSLLVRARVSLYEGRGDFQLIIEHAEPAGEGLLRLKFEELKRKLAGEGLFDERHKKPLPRFPRAIGIITSPTGAAIRDILSVLKRRFACLPIVIYPVPVQGEGAAPKIAAMIRTADERGECDVLILARGGGSLEDLWPFNEEIVARAIHDCVTPLVTGVGHEIDFSIADFVADLRAPTPSVSAELVSPDCNDIRRAVASFESRLRNLMLARLARQAERIGWLGRRLVHPGRRLQQLMQRLDELTTRLLAAAAAGVQRRRADLIRLSARLAVQNPAQRLRLHGERCAQMEIRLRQAMRRQLQACSARWQSALRALNAVSPLATLERGYAIVTLAADQSILRDASAASPGDTVHARLARGRLSCVVEAVQSDRE
ncbi:MAG: exodeoxyribonuclease VII large subunit [Chromatiales bacterium]